MHKITVTALVALANLGTMFSEQPVYAKTPLQMLQESPKPHFRQGHTLLPLTRWGWTMPFAVRVELAEHWGYALEFGPDASPDVVKQLDDPKSAPARICALTASDPKKYPLCVLTSRPLLDKTFLDSLPAEAWCHDAQGKLIEAPSRQLSPEAPDEVFLKAGRLAAEPLAKVRQKAPIAMILNGGEYGLGVMGFGGPVWEKDPTVIKAKGSKDWFRYISERKVHQELLISRAIQDAVPDRRLYIYYPTSECPHHGRTADWWRWTWDYAAMKPVSDLPNISIYYKEFNSGWTGQYDMLTQVLNAVGGDIAQGEPLSYNWLCGGWVQKNLGPEAFSDPEHYMGFLKCYYTVGMIGGVAGYFSYPPGGFEADLGDQVPSWLQQMVTLAHAQALFSHLEDLIRQGDLLPSPNRHRWVKDRPAYEFPTGDKEARAMARRHRQRPEWLLTAWAAGGPDREVIVEIPELGTVKLQARGCGSVYRATLAAGKPVLKWLDENGMYPTAAQQATTASADPSPFDDGRFSWKASAPLVTPSSMADESQTPVKAFCIDFNWGPKGINGFAGPGVWADASPADHVRWYEGLGANVIQTFAVSCNGYAWYKGGIVPPQPGLKHDFLAEVVRLGHAKGIRVMGYYCVGANTLWGQKHPDLSYGTPSAPHIPFTTPYLDYLCGSMEDALVRTGMDGFMIDWVWNPSRRTSSFGKNAREQWLDCEKVMYRELMNQPFPGEDRLSPSDKLTYERRALDRCWTRIHAAAKRANPNCVIWLSCNDLKHPTVVNSKMFREIDWLMNEHPDPAAIAAVTKMAGPHTQLVQCLVGWGDQHDAKKVLENPGFRKLGIYGFAKPGEKSLPLPIAEYRSKPVGAFTGNDKNIAVLLRYFQGLPLDYIDPTSPR